MSSKRWTIVCLTLTLLIFGCSSNSSVSESPTGETLAAASTTPTSGSAAEMAAAGAAVTNGGPSKVEPFRNPFAPPKDPPPPPIIEEPEPEPEPDPEPIHEIRQPGVPPKIRLLGFMNIGGPKVLVSYRDDPETLAIGDTLEDMKVVKIESPVVTMLFEEREIEFSLFDQAWRHEGDKASAGNSNRAQTRPRSTRLTRGTSTSAASAAKAGDLTREPSGIPAFGPNAGRPPGFQPPPASSSASPTSEAPSGSPASGLPGLSREENGGEGIGGGFPGLPELDAGADSKSGAGDWPGVLGGL